MQDAYAIESYRRAEEAVKNGFFDAEIAPVSVPNRRGDPTIVDVDEEWNNIKHDKVGFPSRLGWFSFDMSYRCLY